MIGDDIVAGGLIVLVAGEALLQLCDFLVETVDGEVGFAELAAEGFIFADEGRKFVRLHANIIMSGVGKSSFGYKIGAKFIKSYI